jgi:acyl-coenzyme A synthetase/AMP-(fatty) acid ligase
LLTPEPRPPTVATVLGIQSLNVLSVPSLAELLDITHEHFPYNKKFEDAKNEPLVAIHTSGTTGLPKPIIYTNDFAAAFVRCLQLDPPEGHESMEKLSQGNRSFNLSPPFHVGSPEGLQQTPLYWKIWAHISSVRLFLS